MGEFLFEKTRFEINNFFNSPNNYKTIIGYHNCLPLLQKYKTLTRKKEDLVQLCVNQIEELKEKDSESSDHERPALKFFIEDAELDMSSQRDESEKRIIINLEIPFANLCKICFTNYKDMIQIGLCKHSFCKECLTQYLHTLINNGQVFFKFNKKNLRKFFIFFINLV